MGWQSRSSKNVTLQETSFDQCDQMARLNIQYLAIYNKDKMPNKKTFCQSKLKKLPNTKAIPQK